MDALLPRIAELLATEYGAGLQPPCSLERLTALRQRCARELGAELPDGYAALLARADGVVWNGTTFFASQRAPVPRNPESHVNSLIEMNLVQRQTPEMEGWLVLGESGMEMYAQELASGRFHVLDQVSLYSFEEYLSFDEVFDAAYRKRLEDE